MGATDGRGLRSGHEHRARHAAIPPLRDTPRRAGARGLHDRMGSRRRIPGPHEWEPLMDEDFDPAMSIGHGMLRFRHYEIHPDGRERAVYTTEWEAAGRAQDHTPGSD